jgi:glucosamine kinase
VTELDLLLLGVDGGGTCCRARLCDFSGAILGEGKAGPANIRFGLEQSFAAVQQAATQCGTQAGLVPSDLARVVACLALAGASEPGDRAAAEKYPTFFHKTIVIADAQAACIGAHAGQDGGVIVVGTGTIGWAERGGRQYRVGGWGLPVSDEGSGAWLGCEVLRRVLWAHDFRIPWTGLLTSLFGRFQSDPHAIVRWLSNAAPRDFGSLAPIVAEHARSDDPTAIELMQRAATHVDALAVRLVSLGIERIALVGGLAGQIEPWLAEATKSHLVPPVGDALDGALRLARNAVQAVPCRPHLPASARGP